MTTIVYLDPQSWGICIRIRIKDGWKTAILGIISSSIVVTHNIEISIQSGEKKPKHPFVFAKSTYLVCFYK